MWPTPTSSRWEWMATRVRNSLKLVRTETAPTHCVGAVSLCAIAFPPSGPDSTFALLPFPASSHRVCESAY
jgi:hypothetical protein